MKFVRYTLAIIATLIFIIALLMVPITLIPRANFDLSYKILSVFNAVMMFWMMSDAWEWARRK